LFRDTAAWDVEIRREPGGLFEVALMNGDALIEDSEILENPRTRQIISEPLPIPNGCIEYDMAMGNDIEATRNALIAFKAEHEL
jgi:hypothetical protein